MNYQTLEQVAENMKKVSVLVENKRVTLNLEDNTLSMTLQRNVYIDGVTLYDFWQVIRKGEIVKVTESEFFGLTLHMSKLDIGQFIYLM